MAWLLLVVVGAARAMMIAPRGSDPLAEELRRDARAERRLLVREVLIVAFVVAVILLRASID